MRYQSSFIVDAPLEIVQEFHKRPSSLAAITPPPLRVHTNGSAQNLDEGGVIAVTIKLGFLPLIWEARIEDANQHGFVDRLLRGPFKRWIHRHTFKPLGENRTQVTDEIDFTLLPHLFWGTIGALLALGLPILFRYRAWKTRRLLHPASLCRKSASTQWLSLRSR